MIIILGFISVTILPFIKCILRKGNSNMKLCPLWRERANADCVCEREREDGEGAD